MQRLLKHQSISKLKLKPAFITQRWYNGRYVWSRNGNVRAYHTAEAEHQCSTQCDCLSQLQQNVSILNTVLLAQKTQHHNKAGSEHQFSKNTVLEQELLQHITAGLDGQSPNVQSKVCQRKKAGQFGFARYQLLISTLM